MTARHTVLLIDDHTLFRKGVTQLIEMDQAFAVVGAASSGPEGVEMAVRLKPEVILIDLDMPEVVGHRYARPPQGSRRRFKVHYAYRL